MKCHSYFIFKVLNFKWSTFILWKMNRFMRVLIVLWSVNAVLCYPTLSIIPFGRDIILEEKADLNLTCKVVTRYKSNIQYELSWKLPTRSNTPSKKTLGGGDRITVFQSNDHLTVTIHNMQEEDTGLYVCKLQDNGIIYTRKISVFVRSKKCVDPFFDCGGGLCIAKRYVCDGYVDCPSGYDEAFKYCGQDACNGKILCDGRCISKMLCCDPLVESNCSANYVMPCCQNHKSPGDPPPPCSSPTDPCHYSGGRYYGNSILYIVASCAAVVMVVSTVIMFLACRLCSRHPEDYHRWSRVPTHQSAAIRDSDSGDNLDFLFDDPASSDCPPDDFVLLNFVPGTGFELAAKPPPYTANAIGVPPPPYESCVDLTQGSKSDGDQTPPGV